MTESAALSLFALLESRLGDRLAPIQATKTTLVDVSHLLEDMVLRERLPAMIFTGFQESSYWREETQRYRDLAGVAHQICIFAGGALPREQDQRQIHVRLHGPDPLRQEWFLLVLTEQFVALLCGRDNQAPVLSEGERTFATLWSFEPEIIAETLALLRGVVARERPDRLADLDDATARFPPGPPDARLITDFTARLVDNLTRQHQARLRVERAMAYEGRLRALGQVISGVAHELNNPLQSVLGFAALLQEDEAAQPLRADIDHIVAAAERAQSIVKSLLQLARPIADSMLAVDLGPLVEQTIIFVRGDIEAHQVLLRLHIEPDLPQVLANPTRIQQLLINLLTNAIQALAERPTPRQIDVTVASQGLAGLLLRIADNGPGIPAELHERVFEPFFTTKPVGQGTGLGLSIVQTIVTEHRGSLALESERGGGTRFTIQLPAVVTAASADDAPTSSQGKGDVLVVDDDPQVRALLERMLRRDGYRVEVATSAQAALDLLAQRPFDAILCDVLMPDMDGMAFYAQLHDRHPELCTRLIFITGDATRPTTRAFLQGTGSPYLGKPFTLKTLRDTLQQVIAKNQP